MKPSKLVSWLCAAELLALSSAQAVLATESQLRSNEDFPTSSAAGTEYVSGNYPGAVLMPVNLWGAVVRPGIHHVPTETDLMSLLSYAGGPIKDAKLTNLAIKRKVHGEDQVFTMDVHKILTSTGDSPFKLQPNDIVYVEQKEDTISTDTLKTVTFVSAILGIVLTTLLIKDEFKTRP